MGREAAISAVPPVSQADDWARAFHAEQGAPAMAFAVADCNGPAWSAACGTADIELDVPTRPEHVFRVGSVSKVLTTTAAARLVSRGMIELDTPIAYWLPDLPAHHRQTTLRQLLTHRGGVRHYLPKDIDPKQPGGSIFTRPTWTNAEILAAFIDDALVAPVGGRVSYSSWGYSLASLVMEAAASQPFLDLIQAEVGQRFGLQSLAADDPVKLVTGRVRGYVSASERQYLRAQFPDAGFPEAAEEWVHTPPVNPGYCWAGAGFLLDMPDLARFGAALLAGPGSRISDEERALLFTPLTEKCDTSPPLGLGWRVDEDAKGRARWHHAGATLGGRAVLVIYPGQALSIALASNAMTMPGDVLGPAGELADLFTG
jgi:CubicO group peptidase (beta-lactamase class C family)